MVEAEAERDEQLRDLIKAIEAAVFTSETTRDFNTLALILMVRALDIFEGQYDRTETLQILNYVVRDRAKKRKAIEARQSDEKREVVKLWLPKEKSSGK